MTIVDSSRPMSFTIKGPKTSTGTLYQDNSKSSINVRNRKIFSNSKNNQGRVYLNEKIKNDNYLKSSYQTADYMKTLMMDKNSFEMRTNSEIVRPETQ